MTEKLIDKLTKDILEDNYFNDLFVKASRLLSADLFNEPTENLQLEDKEYIHLLRFADILSNSSNAIARNKSYQIISILNDKYKGDSTYRTYAKAVFAKLGNFPAIEYLETKDLNYAELPFDRNLEKTVKEIVQSVPDTEGFVFTDVQFKLFKKLSNSKLFSFSGPTSMGKSFVIKSFIREVLKNVPKENIVIMVPTRALINQFTLDLKSELGNYIENHNYKIITNSNVSEILEENFHYIFILTPERLQSYLSKGENPPLGFLFVDEAHKMAAQKDLRSITAYNAIERALQKYTNINLYFASPNVSNPEVFLRLFDKNPHHIFYTPESPVSQNLFFVDMLELSVSHYIDESINIFHPKLLANIKDTNNLISHLGMNDYNIVYCNSKSKTIEKSLQFTEMIKNKNYVISEETHRAIKQIKNYIHKDFYLASFLEGGIAYHYGSLPQVIRNTIENLYRDGHIKYLFCTSTLLEGVNLPAKNIFILVNKNGLSTFTEIDFWNLAGRAGRLRKELSGNIYCIKDNASDWKNQSLLEKSDIKLKPTIEQKTDTKKELKNIEKILLEKEIRGTQVEKEILEYIANIICIDTLKLENGYQSPVIQKLIERNKTEIISIAERKARKVKAPLHVLTSNQSIDVDTQNKVFNYINERKSDKSSILLPGKVSYPQCLAFLNKFYTLYEWNRKESELKNKNSMKYFALLMNQWMNEVPLNQIIKGAIDYHDTHNKHIKVDYVKYVKFDRRNKKHINLLIGYIIEDIEQKLRYKFEKYFSHYYMNIVEVMGEENAGVNWAQFLEYGTQNRLSIALQNLGLSRHTANYLLHNHKNCLIVENNKLKSLNKNKLLKEIDKTNLEYEEIKTLFY